MNLWIFLPIAAGIIGGIIGGRAYKKSPESDSRQGKYALAGPLIQVRDKLS